MAPLDARLDRARGPARLHLQAPPHGLEREEDERAEDAAEELRDVPLHGVRLGRDVRAEPELRGDEPGERERDERVQRAVEQRRDEQVRVQAALVREDLAERVERARVRAVPRDGGLHDEPGADEVERGEEEAGEDLRGDGKEDGGRAEGGKRRRERGEDGLEEGVDEWLERGRECVLHGRRQEPCVEGQSKPALGSEASNLLHHAPRPVCTSYWNDIVGLGALFEDGLGLGGFSADGSAKYESSLDESLSYTHISIPSAKSSEAQTHLSLVVHRVRTVVHDVPGIARHPLHLQEGLADLPWLRQRVGGILEQQRREELLRERGHVQARVVSSEGRAEVEERVGGRRAGGPLREVEDMPALEEDEVRAARNRIGPWMLHASSSLRLNTCCTSSLDSSHSPTSSSITSSHAPSSSIPNVAPATRFHPSPSPASSRAASRYARHGASTRRRPRRIDPQLRLREHRLALREVCARAAAVEHLPLEEMRAESRSDAAVERGRRRTGQGASEERQMRREQGKRPDQRLRQCDIVRPVGVGWLVADMNKLKNGRDTWGDHVRGTLEVRLERGLDFARHTLDDHLFGPIHKCVVMPHELFEDRALSRLVFLVSWVRTPVDLLPELEEELRRSMSAPAAGKADVRHHTRSSPHVSIAFATYFALTRALQRRCTPSTPAVSLCESPPLPVPAPSAPGTARMSVDESVSNASSDDEMRLEKRQLHDDEEARRKSRSTMRTSSSASASSSAISHASGALMISKYWSMATAIPQVESLIPQRGVKRERLVDRVGEDGRVREEGWDSAPELALEQGEELERELALPRESAEEALDDGLHERAMLMGLIRDVREVPLRLAVLHERLSPRP
ncbi:hypothetical protein ACG7TL_000871 [Trametes sanguinea]